MIQLRYCKDCNSVDTWVRNPAGDWKSGDKIVEYSYICTKCKHKTLVAADYVKPI
jgi:hypothetical protein